jgi:hypothetical protein
MGAETTTSNLSIMGKNMPAVTMVCSMTAYRHTYGEHVNFFNKLIISYSILLLCNHFRLLSHLKHLKKVTGEVIPGLH